MCVFVLLNSTTSLSQNHSLNNNKWRVQITENGTLNKLEVNRNSVWNSIPVQLNTYNGTKWYRLSDKGYKEFKLEKKNSDEYEVVDEGLELSIRYALEGEALLIEAKAKNITSEIYKPEKLGIILGISHYMSSYPQWNHVYFPTFLRSEKTHFTGYMQNPNGDILGIASPDPIASWSLNYNAGYYKFNRLLYFGHRIFTSNLDLINDNHLPERHPHNMDRLLPGETKIWRIYIQDIKRDQDISTVLANLAKAPVFKIPITTQESNKNFNFSIDSEKLNNVYVITPTGEIEKLEIIESKSNGRYNFNYLPESKAGVYTIIATNEKGKQSEAKISVRKSYSWYMQQARKAVFEYPQRASTNCESWYGFYTAYLAQQYFPDSALFTRTEERFEKLTSLMYDTIQWQPSILEKRIQNSATMIGIMVDRYLATKDVTTLESASKLADWLIDNNQTEDGVYRGYHGTHYTSVIYIAKSLMELLAEEKKLIVHNNFWERQYNKHYTSVKMAVDQLMLGVEAMSTEGEMTYEDGMISCSALQIAAFALIQEDSEQQARYTKMAADLLEEHQSLTQLFTPDSRQRGGTLRFWEAQYDVLIDHNLMSSPHGWSSWRTYGTYYLYLLTGDEKWLVQTMNAIGSAVQMIDIQSGKMNWAFVVDPYVKTRQNCTLLPKSNLDTYVATFHPLEGETKQIIVGEQYIPMISDWFYNNACDNTVHEHFKCIEEVALTAAYVLKKSDGSWLAYNCEIEESNNNIVVKLTEKLVNKIHVNFKGKKNVKVIWADSTILKIKGVSKMQWINK